MAVYVDNVAAQFENVNELRKYPFAEGSSLVDSTGRELPLDAVVDIHMVVPYGTAPEMRLSSVHLSPAMVSACFVSSTEGVPCALSVIVAASDFKPYFPYRMEKLAGSIDVGGVVSFGDLEFPGFAETYRLENAVVHPGCIAMAKPAGLRKFVDRRSGQELSGDVRMSFSGYVESSRDGKSFRLGMSKDDESELASQCVGLAASENACGATPIRTINGVSPDEDGNMVLWFH